MALVRPLRGALRLVVRPTPSPLLMAAVNGGAGLSDGAYTIARRWATHKAGGSSKNGRDSESKRLGVKKFGGEKVVAGNIIIRQRGTKYHASKGVGLGRDHTIFATRDGYVRFWYNIRIKRQEVSVRNTPHPLRIDAATGEDIPVTAAAFATTA